MRVDEGSYVPATRGEFALEDGLRFIGHVVTPYGIVAAQAWGPVENNQNQWVLLTAVVGGRLYWRSEHRPPSRELTERGISIVAGRWIRSLSLSLQQPPKYRYGTESERDHLHRRNRLS